MNLLTVLWAIFSLIFLVLELGHPSLLYFLSLSFGSLAACMASYWHLLISTQVMIFFAATLIILLFFKKFLKKLNGFHYHTNADALIGKQALVTAAISSDAPGYVKIQGELWLARSNTLLPLYSKAKVIEVRGAHVIVEPYN